MVAANIEEYVSRETIERLGTFAALVRKWNPKINLVSKAGLETLWERHILDSVQVFEAAPPNPAHWADLGSGGGFPGIVAAIMAAEKSYRTKFTLVESDQRKAVFLRNAAREIGLRVDVTTERIEALTSLSADVLSARALAPLVTLFGFAHRHLAVEGTAIFPKGRSYLEEVELARQSWCFNLDLKQSQTDPDSQILLLTGITRA